MAQYKQLTSFKDAIAVDTVTGLTFKVDSAFEKNGERYYEVLTNDSYDIAFGKGREVLTLKDNGNFLLVDKDSNFKNGSVENWLKAGKNDAYLDAVASSIFSPDGSKNISMSKVFNETYLDKEGYPDKTADCGIRFEKFKNELNQMDKMLISRFGEKHLGTEKAMNMRIDGINHLIAKYDLGRDILNYKNYLETGNYKDAVDKTNSDIKTERAISEKAKVELQIGTIQNEMENYKSKRHIGDGFKDTIKLGIMGVALCAISGSGFGLILVPIAAIRALSGFFKSYGNALEKNYYKELEKELKDAEIKLKGIENKTDKLKEDIGKLEAKNNKLDKQIERQENRLKDAEKDGNSKKAEKIEKDLDKLKAEKKENSEKLENTKDELSKFERVNKDDKDKIETKDKDNTEKEATKQEKPQEKESDKDSKDKADKSEKDKGKDKGEKEKDKDEKSKEKPSEKVQDKSQEKKQDPKEKIENIKEKIKDKEAEVKKLDEKIELQKELKDNPDLPKHEINLAKDRLKEAENDKKDAKNEIENLKNDLYDAKKDYEKEYGEEYDDPDEKEDDPYELLDENDEFKDDLEPKDDTDTDKPEGDENQDVENNEEPKDEKQEKTDEELNLESLAENAPTPEEEAYYSEFIPSDEDLQEFYAMEDALFESGEEIPNVMRGVEVPNDNKEPADKPQETQDKPQEKTSDNNSKVENSNSKTLAEMKAEHRQEVFACKLENYSKGLSGETAQFGEIKDGKLTINVMPENFKDRDDGPKDTIEIKASNPNKVEKLDSISSNGVEAIFNKDVINNRIGYGTENKLSDMIGKAIMSKADMKIEQINYRDNYGEVHEFKPGDKEIPLEVADKLKDLIGEKAFDKTAGDFEFGAENNLENSEDIEKKNNNDTDLLDLIDKDAQVGGDEKDDSINPDKPGESALNEKDDDKENSDIIDTSELLGEGPDGPGVSALEIDGDDISGDYDTPSSNDLDNSDNANDNDYEDNDYDFDSGE